jgi:hypothetical protein
LAMASWVIARFKTLDIYASLLSAANFARGTRHQAYHLGC